MANIFSSTGQLLVPGTNVPVRTRYFQSDIVAVLQPDDRFKVLKNRWGLSGVSYTKELFDVEVKRRQELNPHIQVNLWVMDWVTANKLLKGLVAL